MGKEVKDLVKAIYECQDCGRKKGEYHHTCCDIERCPICGLQLLSCDCEPMNFCEVITHYEKANKKLIKQYITLDKITYYHRHVVSNLDEDFSKGKVKGETIDEIKRES